MVIEPLKNQRVGSSLVAKVRIVGANRVPKKRDAGELWVDKDFVQITFTEPPPAATAVEATDGGFLHDNYSILRTDGTKFFGVWSSGDDDDDNPPRGYFCASPIRSTSFPTNRHPLLR
jgi:hypothetical protein